MRDTAARWAASRGAVAWEPVTLRGASVPWMGLACDVPFERPWVWEVVTPELFARHESMRDDPMTLVCERDVVLCELDADGRTLWMQVPVWSPPTQVMLPHGLLPQGWELALEAVWSKEAVNAAIDGWALVECGHTLEWGEPGPRPARFEVDEGVYATSRAMDTLLGEDGEFSAAVTSVFSGVVEALGDQVRRTVQP